MKRLKYLAALSLFAGCPFAAQAATDMAATQANGMALARCLVAASAAHQVPLGVIEILLSVEGGSLGAETRNTNQTVDIGPMQVNSIWLPAVAAHWRTTLPAAHAALRDNFCANVEAGSWILHRALEESHGDLWEGVGLYHSHDASFKATYLRRVLSVAERLQHAAPRQASAASLKGNG